MVLHTLGSGDLKGEKTGFCNHRMSFYLLTCPDQEYLRVFAHFPNLENLQLPASHHLDMGFDGGAWCGNAYDGPEGRAYGRSVTQEHAETTQLAANVTMDALPRLKSLQVGSESANLTLNDLGQPDMTWPWTGRMKQYTYEIWEELDDESAY